MKRIFLNEISIEELEARFGDVFRVILKEELHKNQEIHPLPQDVFISMSECALLLNCSINSIRKYIRTGTIPAKRLCGRILISKADAINSLKAIKTIKYSRQNNY